jgi:hypothetical protein
LWVVFPLLDPDPLTRFRIRIQSGSGTLISFGFLSIFLLSYTVALLYESPLYCTHRCCSAKSARFLCGTRSVPDPLVCFYKDPDPATSSLAFPDAKKIFLPPKFFCLLLSVVTFMSFFKNNKLLSTNAVPKPKKSWFSFVLLPLDGRFRIRTHNYGPVGAVFCNEHLLEPKYFFLLSWL